MNTEQYIEHEVKIRVQEERFKIMENKLNWIMSLVGGGLIVPVILHFLRVV